MSTALRATRPTPIFNHPRIQEIFGHPTLPLCGQGLLRPLEMIALEHTRFTLIAKIDPFTYQVETNEYNVPYPLYIDSRFVVEDPHCKEREKNLPPAEQILAKLKASLGLPYLWGGNWSSGIPEIATYYNGKIPEDQKSHYLLQGVDCSGLLYEATNGFTPRNAKELLHFGKEVFCFEDVKPLDILVWPGHVVISLGKDQIIESRIGVGVTLNSLENLPSVEKIKIKRLK